MARTTTIQFNWFGLYQALTKYLVGVINSLAQEFYREAVGSLPAKAKSETEIDSAVVEGHTDFKGSEAKGIEYINARCWFYAEAIMASFGTGGFADTSADSYWEEYKKSELWNPERTGVLIVGRPARGYTDIYGRDQISTGARAGQPVNGRNQIGTHSIQTAEAWLIRDGETRIERRLSWEIEKFISENAYKYFIQIGG